MEDYIETYSGRRFYFLEPEADSIDITDIAHSLSLQCRYTGHCRNFYSVAEHSILVSNLLPVRLKLAGLLHDASEAYLTDVASPIKPHLSEYTTIEDNIHEKVFEKYGVDLNLNDRHFLKQADLLALQIEAYYLVKSRGKGWMVNDMLPPLDLNTHTDRTIACHSPNMGEQLFLVEFDKLMGAE